MLCKWTFLCYARTTPCRAPHLMIHQSTKNVKQSRWLNLKVWCHLVNAQSKMTTTLLVEWAEVRCSKSQWWYKIIVIFLNDFLTDFPWSRLNLRTLCQQHSTVIILISPPNSLTFLQVFVCLFMVEITLLHNNRAKE